MIERERRRIHDPEPMVSDRATNGSGEINADSPLVDKLHELERRVSAACAAASAKTASQLNELLDDLQHGIVAAEQYAASERDAAYDPAREPDLRAANERMSNAQLLHGRLATQQPRLLRRCQQVQQQEEIATYISKRDTLRGEHTALQTELAEVYADAASKIIDVFSRVRAFRQRRMTELGPPPSGVDGFPEFTALALLDKVVLFDLDAKVQTWPPHEPFAATFVQNMGVPPHPGQHWSDPEIQQRRHAELVAEQQRNAEYHQAAARAEDERQNRTLRDQFEQSQRHG